MKWINGAGARFWLDDKSVAILDREARVAYSKMGRRLGIRAISGGWVRNTRRVRKLLRLARRNALEARGVLERAKKAVVFG